MEHKIELESLSAKNKLEKESAFYLSTLDKVLKENNTKNIAITGGYGAGKTTIIDSYFEDEDKAKEMMRISIGTFQSDKEFDSQSSKNQNLLEQQILQQMFFQVNPNKILNSKFIRLSDLSFFYTFGILLYILFTSVFTTLIIKNNWLNQFYTSTDKVIEFFVLNHIWLILLSVVIIFNGLSIWWVLVLIRKLGVSKFGVANTTIEFSFKDGSTVFNHYIDEIIYLFKKTDYKYIVFEDLDRFRDIEIFERLRGLNTTLNQSAHIKDRDIKFIYALKDDLFTGEDNTDSIYNRTKFFDFIIPTVKVMHSSTAESLLLDKLSPFLNDSGNQPIDNVQKISRDLVEDVALFINDMRTLINICNEFEIFRLRLKESSITYDHLFAFIVYKNIYPSDYSNLIENKGIVYEIFNEKGKIIELLRGEIENLRLKQKEGIGSIITDKEDVAILFAKKIDLHNTSLKQDHIQLISNNSIYNDRLYHGKRTLEYFLNNDIEGEFTLYRNDKAIRKYLNVEEFVTINSVNYLDLYKNFDEKVKETNKEIGLQINILSKNIQDVETKSISRLIKENGIDLHVNLKNERLLYLLIRNNWLNESYEDYLTVFREGTITKKENHFIQSIKLGHPADNLFFPLKNPTKVAKRIRVDDISSLAVVNVSLITHLLNNNNDINYEKTKQIVSVIFNQLNTSFTEFINLLQALEMESSSDNLIWEFLKVAQDLGYDVWKEVEMSNINKEQKETFVIVLLENANCDELSLSQKSLEQLQKFISKDLDEGKITNKENVFLLLTELDVKLISLTNITDKTILSNIVNTNSYEVNLNNIRDILGIEQISIEEITKKQIVYEYISKPENIKSLITEVILKQDKYIEKEETFIEFIKILIDEDYDVHESVIQSIIKKWVGVIIDLKKIESIEIIKVLIDEMKFDLTWNNLLYCEEFFEKNDETFSISTVLSKGNNWGELIKNSYKEIQDEFVNRDQYQLFVNNVLELDLDVHPKMESFISNLCYLVDVYDISTIDNKVIELLIDNKVLIWSIDVYDSLQLDEYKIEYVKDRFCDVDFSDLIVTEKLVWSIDLFELIKKGIEIEENKIEKYILDNLIYMNEKDLKRVLELHDLDNNEKVIQTLVDEPNKESVLITFLLEQLNSGLIDDLTMLIQSNQIPWNKELLQMITENDMEFAAEYLLNNIKRISEVNITQEMFEKLIIQSKDAQIISDLIYKYQNNITLNESISMKLYEILTNVDKPKVLLSKLEQKTVSNIINNLSLKCSAVFLYEYLKYKDLNRKEILKLLSTLIDPLGKIKLKRGQVRIEDSHKSIKELLNYLKDTNTISSFVENDKGYIINRKVT